MARPEAPHGNRTTVTLRPSFCACVSVSPAQASSGSVKTTAGIAFGWNADVLAGNHFDGDPALVRRLVSQHRLADDVADGEDRRLGGPQLLVDDDEAALVDTDASLVEARHAGVGPAADRHEHAVEQLLRCLGADALSLERDADAARARPSSASRACSAAPPSSSC